MDVDESCTKAVRWCRVLCSCPSKQAVCVLIFMARPEGRLSGDSTGASWPRTGPPGHAFSAVQRGTSVLYVSIPLWDGFERACQWTSCADSVLPCDSELSRDSQVGRPRPIYTVIASNGRVGASWNRAPARPCLVGYWKKTTLSWLHLCRLFPTGRLRAGGAGFGVASPPRPCGPLDGLILVRYPASGDATCSELYIYRDLLTGSPQRGFCS